MSVITILCQGTANSTNRSTSGGSELVISKIATLLAGTDGMNWILNEGAGTAELRQQHNVSGNWLDKKTRDVMGVAAGEGVEANVARSLRFVRDRLEGNAHLTVNLAGHSRGSITCYKIAYHLLQTYGANIPVNIFAIDPVPGNNGTINAEMYNHIALGTNVDNSFLMLAESEHRLNFRPYVDELYVMGNKKHKFDTMPGTHGGINELTGSEPEAAALVLSRALRFLKKNGSPLNDEGGRFIFDDAGALRMYSKLMVRIKKYKAHASVNPLKSGVTGLINLAMSSFNVDKHRIANVAGAKDIWGTGDQGGPSPDDRGRTDHHGLGMSTALQRMGVADPHSQRPDRFFANKEHEKLFEKQYPALKSAVRSLEGSGSQQNVKALREAVIGSAGSVSMMDAATQNYFYSFCQQRNVLA
jgi:hypothetical protein